MRYLKKFDAIKETVGVPTGITTLASKLFTNIVQKLDSNDVVFAIKNGDPGTYKYKTREIKIRFSLELEGRINNYEVNEFNIIIDAHEVDRNMKDESPEITGAYFSPNVEIDRKNFKIKYNASNKIDIGIRFEFPWINKTDGNFWTNAISKLISENKSEVVSTLGHELMHSYDLAFIKGGNSFEDSSEYQGESNLRFGIPTVDKFFFYLYFMNKCESVVRSSEIASRMEAQGTTQEGFMDFIENNKTWKMLKDISKWTYAEFHQELIDNNEYIKKVLDKSDIETDGMSNEMVADVVEDLILNNVIAVNSDALASMLRDPKYLAANDEIGRIFAMITGRSMEVDPDEEKKNEFFKSFIEKMKKDMKNPKHYFESKEKMFNFESNKLLKKISKLFSMAKDTKSNALHTKISSKRVSKMESVLNWEKYQDSIGVKPNISKRKFI